MKKTRARSFSLYILVIGFIIGISYFTFNIVVNGQEYALYPINTHLKGDELSQAGDILDRNSIVLAKTIDGKRTYNDDPLVRKALLHTVGDDSLDISTSVQNNFKSELIGYNIVTGLGAPDFLKYNKDITLTIDSSVCKAAYEKLSGKKGAVCVYNYKTGEVICLVSTPSYDPYFPPNQDDINTDEYEGVYINRALSSSYTPGSVFKVVTSVAALENIKDINDKTYYCNSSKIVDGEKITCLDSHYNINLKDAMAKSCNIAFADMAMDIGKDKMTSTAENLGFNDTFKLENIKISKSIYDVSKANDADLGWSGIGQYNDLLNPFHMMIIMGAIANDGVPVQPYLIKYMTSNMGIRSHVGVKSNLDSMMPRNIAGEMSEIMRYTVKNWYGDSMFSPLSVCAKTGTGEVSGKKPNGWICGYCINDNCPLAFAVIVEDSGYGISSAGPIAQAVLTQAYKTVNS